MKFWNVVGVQYFDVPDAGSGGGGAGTPAPGAPAGGQPGTPAPGAPVGGAPGSGAPAGQPHGQPASQFTYKEDRSNWVPSHKVRQQTETLRRIESELATERARVAALSGVQPPPTGADAEAASIRKQLLEVVPELKEFFDKKDRLFKAADFDFDSVKTQQAATWEQRGNQSLQRLNAGIKEAYNGADVSDKALQNFQGMFISALARDTDLRQRYEYGDSQQVVDEFVKDITEGLLAPLKRTAAAGAADPRFDAARRLPRGGRGGPIAQPAARTVKPSDGDAFHKGAFSRFMEG